jgi:hypothetical protein
VNLQKINEAILELKESFTESDQITVNVSSGTKPWSLLFFGMFSADVNATVFVIDQNNLLWDLKTLESAQGEFDMDVQFRLLGNELKDYNDINIYTEKDAQLIQEIRTLRTFHHADFLQLTEFLHKFQNETTAVSKHGSTLSWMKADKKFEVVMCDKKGRKLQKTLQSEHVRSLVLNTSWFEYEVALLLRNWGKAKQIRMNCLFPATSGSPKNEIDIIVNAGTKLLFVECKTQIKNETDIDKFASAVKVYGGLGSKALFVTDVPMTEKAREKCADNGIMTFCLQGNAFNLPPEKLLFNMLDSELFNINAK